jgi:hypothetical protein
MTQHRSRADVALLVALVAYCVASLVHFTHNAVYIDAYPNLPASLTPLRVYMAWFAETALGVCGYVLLWRGARIVGLLLIALYAALGFDGLAHYSLAPMSAHTLAMNLSIWLEVFAAAAVLIMVATTALRRTHRHD